MCTIFKVLIEFVTILLLFHALFFLATEAYGILAPQPGTEPTPPALEGEVLTTGPPRKPCHHGDFDLPREKILMFCSYKCDDYFREEVQ